MLNLGDSARTLTRLAASALAVLAPTIAFSQSALESLRDPMQPPAIQQGAPASDSMNLTAGAKLQLVLVSPNRKLALVDGDLLHAGVQRGDLRLESVNAEEVVLRAGRERQVLRLYAAEGVQRKSTVSVPAPRPTKGRP